jgi:hypothetical protein
MKRQKIILDTGRLHALLGLGPDIEIVHVNASDDPQQVAVYLSHPGMPDNIPGAEDSIISHSAAQAYEWNRESDRLMSRSSYMRSADASAAYSWLVSRVGEQAVRDNPQWSSKQIDWYLSNGPARAQEGTYPPEPLPDGSEPWIP